MRQFCDDHALGRLGWTDFARLAALRARLPGYAPHPDTLQRRFLETLVARRPCHRRRHRPAAVLESAVSDPHLLLQPEGQVELLEVTDLGRLTA